MLLHPFMMSQIVWETVASQLANTGRYEVFAPTMAAHHGGPSPSSWLMSVSTLADRVEQQLDELSWETAHLVGNSLGGWVVFELERRGRARSVTGIAPAGGWERWSLVKFEVIAKFVAGMPLVAVAKGLGSRALSLPLSRRLTSLPLTGSPGELTEHQLHDIIEDARQCPAYFLLLIKALLQPGLQELVQITVPAQLVLCEKDRVLPPSRYSRYFTDRLPEDTQVTMLNSMGHVPMFEAPEIIAKLITNFVDKCSKPTETASPAS
ncbi:alpha/beta fold hydrolase [Mycobacterium uberis]|uniref:alpha/beta fold hydrolase n=1 Tax=Mycobacterium uberis TaxID=2162698 RepID=UPI0014024F9A|nr:alpha/beta hydrolase [Mycobacterium uberis]